MTLAYYGCSETGSVRENNEDALLLLEGNGAALFLVADGVGGRAHGEVASGMLRDGYDRWWQDTFLPARDTWDFRQAVEQLRNALEEINRQVVDRFGHRNVGSTVVLLFFFQGYCAYLSAGDSRIYRVRGMKVQQMTLDDTVANLPEDARLALAGAADGKLVGAVGISGHLEFSLRTDRLENGDCFFLCSDGVYRCVPAQKLHDRLRWGGLLSAPRRVVERLCQEVERGGSSDNYTMIFVKVR